jgi:hypothetical protein
MFSRLQKPVVLAAALFATFAIQAVAHANTLYVSPDGAGGAYTSIQAALNAARDGDTISVAAGTYAESLSWRANLRPSNLTIQGAGADRTFIDPSAPGGPGGRCLSTWQLRSSAHIDGFTFQHGSADNGGGMFNDSASNITVTNCVFRDNSVTGNGGGMYNYYFSQPTLINCTFTNNAAGVGGGMNNWNSSPTITNCAFNGNSAYSAGGMYNTAGSPTITNCTFSGNTANNAGGLFNYLQSSPTITNCTFSSNTATYMGAMANYDHSNPTITNCILWGNAATYNARGITSWESSFPTVTYTDLEDLSYTARDSNGNFAADPLFVRNPSPGADQEWGTTDDDLGDLHLQALSPCLGTGNNAVVTSPPFPMDPTGSFLIDLDGNPRIADGTVDLGAYEYITITNRAPVANAGNDQTVEATGTMTSVHLDGSGSSDPDGDALNYAWSEGGTDLPNGDTASPNVSLPLGAHTLTLTVTDPSGASDSDDVVVTVADTTTPTLTWGTATPAPNAAGWNNTAVDLPFTTDDSGSGVASVSATSPLHFALEGANQTKTVTVTDNAGNHKDFTSPAVNIDLTAPTTSGSASGGTVTLSASDSLSGVKATYYTVDGGAPQTYTAPFTVAAGQQHTVRYWSVDKAGNQEAARSLTVDSRFAVTLVVANASGKRGGKASLSATLTQSSNGAKLSGKTITFKIDGATVGSATTDKKGGATVSYTIPSNAAIGSHGITASFAGDPSTYESGTGNGTLIVTR